MSTRKKSSFSSKTKNSKNYSSEDDSINSDEELENDKYKPIRYSEISKFFSGEPDIKDVSARNAMREVKKKKIQTTLQRLNRSIQDIRQAWPNASSLELYVAFDMCCSDSDELIAVSSDSDFKRELNETIQRILNPPANHQDSEENSDSNDSDDSHSESKSQTHFVSRKRYRTEYEKEQDKHHYTCPPGVDPEIFSSWSEAKQRSFILRSKNPNSFYYRNLPPGEVQRNGPWTPEEQAIFLKHLAKQGPDFIRKPKWGLFSMAIPGRVGYQCSNFYRKLILKGEIKNDSYFLDSNGILRQIHNSNQSTFTHSKSSTDIPSIHIEEYRKNPFKDLLDPITDQVMTLPAISPSGTVLDYNTWMNLFKDKKEDPFTTEHVNKRQLVFITTDNIEEYKSKIRNIPQEKIDESLK